MSEDDLRIERLEAAQEFVDLWVKSGVGSDIGASLSCAEADVLAELFIIFDEPDAADALIEEHSVSDDEGDLHYGGVS